MSLRVWLNRLFICSVLGVLTSALGAEPATAQADFFFFGEPAFTWPARRSSRALRQRQRSARERAHHKVKTADAPRPGPSDVKTEAANPEPPLFVVVSIANQQASVYNRDGLVARSMISTGVPGHPTPTGVFTIIGRERYHRSNIYSGAPMPLMQRITWSGIAMHVGVVPGRPASHGCIRLPAAFAAKLWGMTKIGERVIISPSEVTPTDFAHPLLPAPKMAAPTYAEQGSPPGPTVALANPKDFTEQLKAKAVADAAAAAKTVKAAVAAVVQLQEEVARAAAERQAAEAMQASALSKAGRAMASVDAARAGKDRQSAGLARLNALDAPPIGKADADRLRSQPTEAAAATARLEAANAAFAAKDGQLTDALRRLSDATAASQAAANAEAEARRRLMPVSVLISRKDHRIYVRQGLAPLFDAPISVRDPDAPLGSHVFIATAADGTSLRWSVVSLPQQERSSERRRIRLEQTRPQIIDASVRNVSGPAEALERIEMTDDVRDRIAERLWVGGSIIVSDQPLSGETGNVGTDITVKLR
jgi:lipoprotein-anchoring transpeptidase ErfK/SrfK